MALYNFVKCKAAISEIYKKWKWLSAGGITYLCRAWFFNFHLFSIFILYFLLGLCEFSEFSCFVRCNNAHAVCETRQIKQISVKCKIEETLCHFSWAFSIPLNSKPPLLCRYLSEHFWYEKKCLKYIVDYI